MEKTIKTFKKDEVIFREGDFEMCMYDLVQGKVGIYADYEKPSQKLLTELKAEECACFGEMGLVDMMPRSATAVALEDVQVEVITGEILSEYFQENPAAVMLIMQSMSQRIRALTKDYMDACRAVTEAVEAEKTGKAKSSWFKEKVSKFIKDYDECAQLAAKYNDQMNFFGAIYYGQKF
ncbi:MAG: Crp/Fnr family transcriptional regulator [Anaerotignum sp.]